MRALAEAGFEQNEEIKKISSWAAILFAPTLVGTIYGMNFEYLPGLAWHGGFFVVLGTMAITAGVMLLLFRWKKWL